MTKEEQKILNQKRRKSQNQKELYQTNSYKGYFGELLALKILKGSTLLNKDAGDPRFHWDIVWRNLKVNIKTAYKISTSKQHKRWIFSLKGKVRPDCYLCIGFIKNIPQKVFLIPGNIQPKYSLTIPIKNKRSKYYQYQLN